MPIRIRRATPADEEALDQWQQSMEDIKEFINLGDHSVRDHAAVRERYITWLRQPREKKRTVPSGWQRVGLVAVEDNGTICGYATLNFGPVDPLTNQPEAYVSELHVWPEYRGRGVAKGLLQMADAYAVQRGVQYIALHVSAHNISAIQLYRTLGYREETIKMVKLAGENPQEKSQKDEAKEGAE